MPFDEAERLKSLRDYRLLDTLPEATFDNITQLAAVIFDMPIVLVSLIDARRQWFKSRVGIDVQETPRDVAFCDHAIRQVDPLVIPDATADPRFAHNPLVTQDPHIRFYCGVPLRSPEGHGLGTLCLIDRVPRQMDGPKLATLRTLAHQVEIELEIRRRLLLLEENLAAQQDRERSRELMISMLVHDLRAPLSAILLLAGSLSRKHPESADDIQDLIDEAERMRRMLMDALDICLSGVHSLRLRRRELSLRALVLQVGYRLGRSASQRDQRIVFDLPSEDVLVDADPELIERVITNLVVNAIQHGPVGEPITLSVRAGAGGGGRVEVRDLGEVILDGTQASLFSAFEQRGPTGHTRGYGLGLAFCRLALEAHGGSIGVGPNSPRGNSFHVNLPT